MTTLVLALVATVLLALGLRVAGSIVADEVKGWLPHLGRGVLHSAVRRLPVPERARWSEEWTAEHAARTDRPVTALLFAVRVRLNARALATELRLAEAEAPRGTELRDQENQGPLLANRRRLVTSEAFAEALENLSYRERRVMELLYGLAGEIPRTYEQIARTFNVGPERIRQVERQSIMKLQSLAEAQKLREIA